MKKLSIILMLLLAAPTLGALRQRSDSSAELRKFLDSIFDAIRKKDRVHERQLLESLVLPRDSSWFTANFDKRTADDLKSEYGRLMKDFEKRARELYETDSETIAINIRVTQYLDPATAPAPIKDMLDLMNTPVPLYEVSISGRQRPGFQIQLSPTGGPSRVVAGDLSGYFIETSEGFRFIPSEVTRYVYQEREKRSYEILRSDAAGRPELVRVKNGALVDLIVQKEYPVYSDEARKKRVEGRIMLRVHIGKDGKVQEVNVESGPPELHKSAVDAMKKWRFKPFLVDGFPVGVESQFEFQMNIR